MVRGYVIAQLAYSVDSGKLGGKSELLDLALVDEAFKYLFPDDNVDVDQIEKFDSKRMTQTILASVNKRIGVDAVTDIGMQEFVFEQANDAAPKNEAGGHESWRQPAACRGRRPAAGAQQSALGSRVRRVLTKSRIGRKHIAESVKQDLAQIIM